jgi:ribosomal protein S18 acetylase RimI-like enzyme
MSGLLLGCCIISVDLCGIDGLRKKEMPSKRPAWPLPWVRADPFAIARETFSPKKEEGIELRARITGLVVSGAARRAGVGRALVAEAEALAGTWGHSSMLLRVEESNFVGIDFYRRLGYEVPAGCAESVPGTKLSVDRWGTRWTKSTHVPLQRML